MNTLILIQDKLDSLFRGTERLEKAAHLASYSPLLLPTHAISAPVKTRAERY